MSVLHALVLSLLQGAFELFPVSSLGHTVVVPALLGWHLKQSDPSFLAFVVVLHLGTAVALFAFFWRDWVRITRAILRSIASRRLTGEPDERLGWLLVAGSVPTGVLGLFLKTELTKLFGDPGLVCGFLIFNGVLLLAGERLRMRGVARQTEPATTTERGPVAAPVSRRTLTRLSLPAAIGIGTAQSLALLPGFSRSGASIVGGLRAGLGHVDAARFSFLLATPLIAAAGALEVPELFKRDANIGPGIALMGMAISAATAWLAVRFLLRFFETDRLDVFGYYCMVFGAGALVVLALRGAL